MVAVDVDVKRDKGDVSYSSMCPFKQLGGEYTSPLRHVDRTEIWAISAENSAPWHRTRTISRTKRRILRRG